MARLQGQVALVTGAGGGIGGAVALALAGERADIAVTDLREGLLNPVADGVRERGASVLVTAADVTDAQSVEKMVQSVLTHFGRIDILVNTAGINVAQRSLADITPENWRAVVDVNLTGAFLVTRAVLPGMRAQGRGTVISIASWAGKRPIRLAGAAYSASKSALMALTESVNMEERRHGIRACAICPGEVNTPIVEKRAHPPSAAERAAMLQPEDIASAAVFIATLPDRATVEELAIRPTALRPGYDDQVLQPATGDQLPPSGRQP